MTRHTNPRQEGSTASFSLPEILESSCQSEKLILNCTCQGLDSTKAAFCSNLRLKCMGSDMPTMWIATNEICSEWTSVEVHSSPHQWCHTSAAKYMYAYCISAVISKLSPWLAHSGRDVNDPGKRRPISVDNFELDGPVVWFYVGQFKCILYLENKTAWKYKLNCIFFPGDKETWGVLTEYCTLCSHLKTTLISCIESSTME